MPETFFHVRWPDGSRDACYSPSSAIGEYLGAGRPYTVATFVEACRDGLVAAGEGVRQVYGGSGCPRAAAQLRSIEAKARSFAADGTMQVEAVGSLRRSA